MNYIAIFVSLLNLFLSNAENLVVNVEQGKVRGERLRVATGEAEYISFKGIPYARPPIGYLRFMPPQPPAPWTGIRNATEHGSVCVQRFNFDTQNIIGSEDCLYLNVYTPSVNPINHLTVIIYIHGGGFLAGSGNVDRFGPDYLILENIVIVTINYRLGPLGFLALNSKDAPGNAGIKDQVAAMKWVQKNIAAFGGDPNKVTIIGQSAGATSVGLHNLSPLTKGLYKRSVMMSGGPFTEWAWEFKPKRVAFRLGQQLGLWTRDEKELVNFLKSLPADKLFRDDPVILRSENPNIAFKQLTNTPVVETGDDPENFLTLNPVQALKSGKINDVELMTGHVALEGLFFFALFGGTFSLYTNYTEMIVPRNILENIPPAKMFDLADKIQTKYFGGKQIDDKVAKEMVEYVSDSSMHYGIMKYARMFSKYRKTFMYKFSLVTDFPRYIDLSNKYGLNAAAHEDDLLYLFYPHNGNVTITKDSKQYKLVRKFCTLYADFAKNGNPTFNKSLGVDWPVYDSANGKYLDINSNLSIGKNLDAEIITFWDSIYESVGLL